MSFQDSIILQLKQGDVISDRTQARQKLEAKKKQLEIAVEQMSLPITAAAPLPPPNYEVEMATVKKAKFNLKQAEEAYANYPESKFLDRLSRTCGDKQSLLI